ncbi:uncharacterized protein C8A04DRAFT_27314 [Dichotomopilus funicola]|uniref:Uncharacterized protein n=1 Tax=Dichotomopilus funicola TaxID=1934379 RepID=A0AAN6V4V5_9PEZI|nr:hypothetical protein C8A04DRAFT_27314 [Dichotomopilus funicola]
MTMLAIDEIGQVVLGVGTVAPFDTIAMGDGALSQKVYKEYLALAQQGLLFDQTVANYNHNLLYVTASSGPAFRIYRTIRGIVSSRKWHMTGSSMVVSPMLLWTTVSRGTG